MACPDGQYFCRDRQKCMPIPKGTRVRKDGELVKEGSLHKWFKGSKSKDGKGGWVNVKTGGTCASDEPGEGTPKCVSSSKRASMSKAERDSASRRKKAADPNQQQNSGAAKPTYVATDKPKKKMNEKCWDGYTQKGMKKKGKKVVPNCVKEEDKKGKGSGKKDACYHKVKASAKVWPSAYASGRLVQCRKKGASNYGNKSEGFSNWRDDFEFVEEGAAWTKKEGKNKSGGLNEKGRKSYERENPGSDLKAPSKKVGNPRRKSFCARMKGMRKRQKPSNNTGDDRLSKSLRAWNCEYEPTGNTISEVAPPGFGHTKSGKDDKKGGTAAAFDKARKEGRFKGSKSDMFAIMWSQKNKGDKPHYKPGTDKKYKKYQEEETSMQDNNLFGNAYAGSKDWKKKNKKAMSHRYKTLHKGDTSGDVNEALSTKDSKKLNKASVLSYSDDPKDQHRARVRQAEIDFKDLMRQRAKKKKGVKESFEIDTSAHKKVQKKAKMRNLAKGNTNPNEKAAAEKKAGGPKLMGENRTTFKKIMSKVLKKKQDKKKPSMDTTTKKLHKWRTDKEQSEREKYVTFTKPVDDD